MDKIAHQIFKKFSEEIYSVGLLDPNALEKLDSIRQKQKEVIDIYRNLGFSDWQKNAAKALSIKLPNGYEWKNKPTVNQIDTIIRNVWKKQSHIAKKIGYLVGFKKFLSSLIGSNSNSNIYKNPLHISSHEIPRKILTCNDITNINRQKKAVQTLIEQKPLFLKEMNQDLSIQKQILDWIDSDEAKNIIKSTEKEIDKISKYSIRSKNNMIIQLYSFLDKRLDRTGIATEYYGEKPTITCKFLDELVFQLLPDKRDIDTKSIKEIFSNHKKTFNSK